MPFTLHLSRRGALRLGATLAGALVVDALMPVRAENDPDVTAIKSLKAGQWVWYPERAPEGLVAIVVNLTDQLCFVYRNSVRIGVSTVSTGKDGHETPTGVFTILGKDVDHHSSIYNNASMPYTERLTWSGVALHAGGLPGYPSSHGCVHLPLAFSKLVFGITHLGTPVIIADTHSAPQDVLHPGLLMSEGLEQQLAVSATGQGAPPEDTAQVAAAAGSAVPIAPAPPEPVSMVVSGADRTITVLRGAQTAVTGSVTIRDPAKPLGNVVYVLQRPDGGAPRWSAISYEGGSRPPGAAQQALARITVDPSINRQVAALATPGATLFVTDLPAHPGTRNDGGFVVITHKAES
ncbi:L,D-transpeptidase [Xanthobacter autotrophicus]|uniref:L,D-transpeptidase n=1 Tax=Xanthobacter TaxID=279 RepID=UPI0024ABE2D8|nr:L,D-transpeptidase [Xanthobacter autotrophicus]MDI4665782.1 L,D-transpeptidase [Xanthobacter autotrophicus]